MARYFYIERNKSRLSIMKKAWKILKISLYVLAFPLIIIFEIIKGFTEDEIKEKEKYRSSDDKLYGLTKYEKEEIKKGKYKASQFSEKEEGDSLDSDDYYEDE